MLKRSLRAPRALIYTLIVSGVRNTERNSDKTERLFRELVREAGGIRSIKQLDKTAQGKARGCRGPVPQPICVLCLSTVTEDMSARDGEMVECENRYLASLHSAARFGFALAFRIIVSGIRIRGAVRQQCRDVGEVQERRARVGVRSA